MTLALVTLDELATQQTYCQHPYPSVIATGHITVSGGDVLDTLVERLICPDCGADLTPSAVDEYPYPF